MRIAHLLFVSPESSHKLTIATRRYILAIQRTWWLFSLLSCWSTHMHWPTKIIYDPRPLPSVVIWADWLWLVNPGHGYQWTSLHLERPMHKTVLSIQDSDSRQAGEPWIDVRWSPAHFPTGKGFPADGLELKSRPKGFRRIHARHA